ncbi:transcriptional repressor LexA [Lactobacillus sp. S2-2]|uniref:transcriptional repressor LexA n=1 Tax=Lactobacillus sp. S2-2 TaxID=2692917 RepID=UPI001F029786|nr:transcriptional repressor LexA [Lactobacillus sp. S2-2]MCF6514931.1 transcriptional repressor LexA [Lactobacillus sp. S2-2]
MAKASEQKQKKILQFIWDHVNNQGYPPTVREICNAVNLSSPSTVHGHLAKLENNGFLIKDPSKPRAMEITNAGIEYLDINIRENEMPLLGTVTAGEPILAVEEATDYFPIPPELKNQDNSLFMLTIRGTSMINAGIFDGDMVMVKKQSYANNGEIVIAMTDENEATCKRFYKESDHFRLQPENDTLAPIILNNVSILGKVVGLYRFDIK